MSLILDALRKMEKERKLRRESAAALRPQVLSYRGQPAMQERSSLVYWGIGLAILSVAGVTFLFMGRGDGRPTGPERSATGVPRQTTSDVKLPELPAVPLPQTSRTPEAATTSLPTQARTLPNPTLPQARAVAEAVSSAPADNGLTISGIAWQEERQLRRAVVNGSLIGEGGEIAGAKVVEILEYRVRFSRAGRIFDIPFNAGSKGH